MSALTSHIYQIREDLKMVRSNAYPGTLDPISLVRIPGRRVNEKLAKLNLMVSPIEAEMLELDFAAVDVLTKRKYLDDRRISELQRNICKRALIMSVGHSDPSIITMFRDVSTGTQRIKLTGVIDGIFIVGDVSRR